MLIDFIAGKSSDFLKMAPIINAIKREQKTGLNIGYRLIYTGKQSEKSITGDYLIELGVPKPNVYLECGGLSETAETAIIMTRYEKVLNSNKPHLTIVIGETVSSMGCALAAAKAPNVRIAHLEAGIRSNNRGLHDEVNRIVTDAISDYYFTTTRSANENLRRAGIPEEHIFYVGNTLIDNLNKQINYFRQPEIWNKLKLKPSEYALLTLDKPANIEDPAALKSLLINIVRASENIPIVFPLYPKTAKTYQTLGIRAHNLYVVDMLEYWEFSYLVHRAKVVITDSSTLQEETTVMQVPCMTVLTSSDRPETISTGTNVLVGNDSRAITNAFNKLFEGRWQKGNIPYLWDGKASERVLSVLKKLI